MSRFPSARRASVSWAKKAALGLFAAGLSASASPASAKAPYKNPYPTQHGRFLGGGVAGGNIQYAPAAVALERFRIDYAERHDTPIRNLGVEVIGKGNIRGWFSDNDGSPPVNVEVGLRNVTLSPNVEFLHMVKICERHVECLVGTLPRDPDKVPLLAGFSFHNGGSARNVERVAIRPHRVTGPNAHTSYYATFKVDGGRAAYYSVDLYLVLVDRSIVAGEYDASASSKTGEPFAAVPLEWEYGFLALQGFDVRFTNGPHHLQELAIGQIPSNNGLSAVYFSDKNDDDPIRARLWWADLEPPSKKVIPLDKPLPRAKPGYDGPAPELDPSVKGGKKPLPKPKHKPQPKQPKLPGGPLPSGPIGK